MKRENAMMTLHTKKDAASIKAHLDRPHTDAPALDVRSNRCEHIEDPFSTLASKREPCGERVTKDSPSGWLCFEHEAQLFHRKAPCSQCGSAREPNADGKGGTAHSPEGKPLCDRCAKLSGTVGTTLAAVSAVGGTSARSAA